MNKSTKGIIFIGDINIDTRDLLDDFNLLLPRQQDSMSTKIHVLAI